MFKLKPLRMLIAPRARVTLQGDDSATVEIDGLVCSLCASRVAAALGKVDGVEAARCDLETGSAEVQLSRPVDSSALAAAVVRAAIAMPIRHAIERIVMRWRGR